MHYMVMLILDNLEMGSDILDAWEEAGARGITIMESTGLGRMRRAQGSIRELPLMPSLRTLMQSQEEPHRTIFTVVDDEAMIDILIDATQQITGDLNEPNRGVLFVLPVARAVGMGKNIDY